MKKICLLIATFLLATTGSFAQKENNVWVFGDRMGIDFNGTTPTLISSAIRTTGGSASVCNSSGQLLFYTQGDTVWNRNDQPMTNGKGLIAPYGSNASGGQSSQGQLILPVIGNGSQYYVFSVEAGQDYIFNGDPYAGRVYYSVVDMTLNGGLGDVVSTQKKIPVDSIVSSEKMIAIPGSNCSVWLLLHNMEDNKFKAYRIDNNGISSTPVVSACGLSTTPLSYALGKMKASPDGHKIVTSNFLLGNYGCETYDFDPATGTVSNPAVLDSIPQGISACFSPDNSKLYYFSFAGGTGALYQYNLSLSTTAAIMASRTLIDTLTDAGTSVYDAKIAPDGKIYVKMPYSATGAVHDTIGRIGSPNLAGTACAYTRAALVSSQAILLGNGDLPNTFVKPLQDTTFISTSTNLTTNSTVLLQGPSGYYSYQWNTGDTTSSVTATAPGTYWVISNNYCNRRTDTFKVGPRLSVNNITVAEAGITVYPNPAGDDVTVKISGMNNHGSISVTDMLGKTIITTDVQNNTTHINTAALAAGTYIITYTDGSGLNRHTRLQIAR